ncbi:RagB/SusD family nutrient uptake outer membrane protein [Pontibacter sp. G13]|uniref:RagB/SusD family nutrient uptake outer membrane protein n=1 Tax=Pontibacter sp. G13 TaxID=3074898 RepID=UPI0028896FBF|nr:RagB/SusD family nutrient uptake outer membrane protein [Pontibacter sp. G13]WNJ19686.1 RagB/SusD family nutrient uptake outer membrane protein [Pontibacter sp. G13]
MKKLFLYISAAAVMGAAVVGCSSDFLNAPPQGALDEGTLANEAGVNASLISAYSMLDGWNDDWGTFNPPWGAAGSNWIWGSVVSDESYKGSEPGDQLEIQQLELFQWQPGNEYLNIKFQALYEGVARSNATLKLMGNAEDLGNEIPQKEAIIGEVRFLRAHYHFDLWKLWGKIPYYTEVDEDFRKPNDQDPVPSILEDFQFAIDNLPVTQDAVGRATRGAAQAYKGKVHLYNGQYAEAKALFDAVVNSGQYDLLDCYHDIFTQEMENGSEMIFAIQASVNDGTTEGQNGNFGDRLTYPNGGGTFSCCGFHQPSQNLVNSHKVDADGLPLLGTFNDADLDPAADPVDPRLDWTVGRDDVPFLTYGNHGPDWIRARNWAGPYSGKKFIHDPGENVGSSWSDQQLSTINKHIIRYADVLLMLAECEVEMGNLERARELVNMVRERAGNCSQGADGFATSDIQSADITWADYRVGTYEDVWTDQAVAREAVRMERKLELAMEGHRFFDLRRWGVAVEVMNDYLSTEGGKRNYLDGTVMEARHMLYPLPTVQIELSKVDGVAQLQQNNGY